jgi:hypothetical protein
MLFACTQALGQRWLTAVALSGVAFLVHGSFLWAHIAFCGVCIFALLYQQWNRKALSPVRPAAMLAICVLAPAAWFFAEHLFGGATPLRTYYLYNVDVTYGLHHQASVIAQQFYSQTSTTNLFSLPWWNLAKGLLPVEALGLILNFQLAGEATSWQALGEALFRNQFFRTWFALGVVGGIVTWRGLFLPGSSRWLPRLALVAFFLLPLIPGLGLYRRDDHFLLPIMMFAVVPVLISFCIGMRSLRGSTLTLVALTMLVEYLTIYYWRYPSGHYVGEFHAYYLVLATAGLLLVAMAAALPWWRLRSSSGGLETMP